MRIGYTQLKEYNSAANDDDDTHNGWFRNQTSLLWRWIEGAWLCLMANKFLRLYSILYYQGYKKIKAVLRQHNHIQFARDGGSSMPSRSSEQLQRTRARMAQQALSMGSAGPIDGLSVFF